MGLTKNLERDISQRHVAIEQGLALKEGTFKLNIRKKFFSVKVVRHWDKLPRKVVDASLLEAFKGQFGWGFERLGLVKSAPVNGMKITR